MSETSEQRFRRSEQQAGRLRRLVLSISIGFGGLLTLGLPGCATTAKTTPLPDSVVAEIDRLIEECEFEDEKATAEQRQESLDSVERYDLNGDEFSDYLIIDAAVACPAGASFRHGNSGMGVIIFAGSRSGAEKTLDAVAHDVRTEARPNAPHQLWLLLGGTLCGYDPVATRSDLKACERPLEWDAKTAEFVLAPDDQTLFPEP